MSVLYICILLVCTVYSVPLNQLKGQEEIALSGTPSTSLPPNVEEEPSREDYDYVNKPKSSKLLSDEARIEKEVAEMYKDKDYDDSDNVTKVTDNSIARVNDDEFTFQPFGVKDKSLIERYKTSIDELSCNKAKDLIVSEEMETSTGKSFHVARIKDFLLTIILVHVGRLLM